VMMDSLYIALLFFLMIPDSVHRDRTEAQDDAAAGALCLAEGTSLPTQGHCLSAHSDCLLHLSWVEVC